MQIINLLENIATNAHFNSEIKKTLSAQSEEIQELFSNNDSHALKSMLPNNEIAADRTTIFQI